jgi:hypothetical protein
MTKPFCRVLSASYFTLHTLQLPRNLQDPRALPINQNKSKKSNDL